MSYYNPATAYPAPNYTSNPYTANPYVSVPNPFANNPYMAQQQPMNGQPQDFTQGQNQQQPRPQQFAALKGRAVTGIEEARAAQIDFDGTVHMFTDFANGKIYTKQLSNEGIVIFKTYEMQNAAPAPVPVPLVPASTSNAQPQDVNAVVALLQDRISGLENTVNQYKELLLNDKPNADNANVTGKRQPASNASTGGGK